jgi:uncharacterized protein (DUF1697 family)
VFQTPTTGSRQTLALIEFMEQIAGVLINREFNPDRMHELSNLFEINGLELVDTYSFSGDYLFYEEGSFNHPFIDIIILNKVTFAFCSSPEITNSMNLEKASFNNSVGLFIIDEGAGLVITRLSENSEDKCNFVKIHYEIKQAYLNGFETQIESGYDCLHSILLYVGGISDLKELNGISTLRYSITNTTPKLSDSDIEFNKEYLKKLSSNTHPDGPNNSLRNDHQFDKFDVFTKLGSSEQTVVLEQLNELLERSIDSVLISYVLIVSLFHHDTKTRTIASKVFENSASKELQQHISTVWNNNYRRDQMINSANKILEHEEVELGEALCMFQVIRRNFFNVKPASGYNLYLDGKDGEIQNLFNSFTKKLVTLPDTFRLLTHVNYVNISKERNLRLDQIVASLSLLPKLEILKMDEIGLDHFPLALFNFKDLKRLTLNNNKITAIPNNGKFEKLEILEIANCNIEELDLCIAPNLRELCGVNEVTLARMSILNMPPNLTLSMGNSFKLQMNKSNHYA